MNDKHKNLRKRLVRNIIINTVCVLLIVGGIAWIINGFWRYSVYEVTNNAVVDQYVSPVNVRVQGYIKSVRFVEYQNVKAGDTLLVIDDSEYRIKMMDAEAALRDAVASSELLSSSIATSKSNVEVSDAVIKEAEIKLWKLGEDAKRYASLLEEKSVPLQEYERVKTDYESAKANFELLKKEKQSTKLQSEELKSKIGSVAAVIARRSADLEMCRLNLGYTVVLAPYDGSVGRRSLSEGQLVQAGQTLTNIIRGDKKWVTANFKETQIKDIFIGQEVNIKVDAYRGKVFKGVVTAISDATGAKYSLIPIDNSAGNFVKVQQRVPVRIEFCDEESNFLKAGMMVEVEAKIKQ